MDHPDSITIPAPNPHPSSIATVIFLHGFGDDAHGWTDLVAQCHRVRKLPHTKWILPNAPENRDAMAQAWYYPKPFSPIPLPKREGEYDADKDEGEDDEEGMMRSLKYICGLIDKEHADGVPLDRIVVGGFSQGCAIALLVGLMSRYAGMLAGVVGLSGYLPLGGKVEEAVKRRVAEEGQSGLEGKKDVQYFLAHGSRDVLVPKRLFNKYRERIERWVGKENVEGHLYDGMGHSTTGAEVGDLCVWLERLLQNIHET